MRARDEAMKEEGEQRRLKSTGIRFVALRSLLVMYPVRVSWRVYGEWDGDGDGDDRWER